MALIKCPECGKEISDKSTNCIHCGYPLELSLQTEDTNYAEISKTVNDADELLNSNRYSEALALYKKAAILGNSYAQVWVGNIYKRGLGVETDYNEAYYWFEKAAKQGESHAINNLGVMYEKGNGVTKDLEKAANLYEKSAKMNNKYAINNLGVCYMNGKVVERDLKKAEELFNEAIVLGSKSAKQNLNNLQECIAQTNQSTPIKNSTRDKSSLDKPLVARKGFWLFIIAIILFGVLYWSSVDDNSDRTCAWCNGTGYNGNGASTVEEYVFMKTPCKHCKGKGTY